MRHNRCVQLFLRHGVVIVLPDTEDRTPLDKTIDDGQRDLL